tara:strand:+ start:190 stop:903 length:714 start_codon:yes stop_codon:yes gene_type:complete
MKNFAIIIPAFNEKENLEILTKQILKILPSANIYIVDDSKDKDQIPNFKKKNKINYYLRKNKKGRGSAVIYGMKKALANKKNQNFIEMDADFSHSPRELIKNINFYHKNNFDLLISSRYLPLSKIIDWPLKRRIFSLLANFLIGIVLQLNISDYTNGYRIYSKRSAKCIIKECGKIGDGFIILSEILLSLKSQGYKIGEISSIFKNRNRGISNVNLTLIFGSLKGLFNLLLIKIKKK